MPSVLEFLNNALSAAGVVQPAQTASGSVSDVARRKHSDMVRSWNISRLRLFYVPEQAYPLTANLGVYEIGPGAAQFDTTPGVYTRPIFVQSARVIVGTGRRWPLNVLTRPQWDLNNNKNLVDPDGPLDLFYDFNTPKATFNLGPKPGGAQSLLVSQWNPLRFFTPDELALNIEDFYPEEYIEPMEKGLAIILAQTYKRPIDQALVSLFQDSVSRLEAINNDKLSGAFGFSRTLDGPTKGDGSPVAQAASQ